MRGEVLGQLIDDDLTERHSPRALGRLRRPERAVLSALPLDTNDAAQEVHVSNVEAECPSDSEP
jgi:hypothetical protein